MGKLEGKSRLGQRKSTAEKQAPLTTVTTQKNTTSGSPMPLRLTPYDRAELNLWVDALQEKTQKKITPAKLFRGLIHMRDKINDDKLLDAIKEVT